MTRLQDKVSCILEELRIYLEPAILTIRTVPYNMTADQNTRKNAVVSSVVVVVVDSKKKVEGPGEASRTRYLERVKDLDLEDLACRQELTEALWINRLSHEDLSNLYCVDWLNAHEAHFCCRAKTLDTADLTGNPQRSIMGPINYRPLKELLSPGLIVEPPKHRTSMARIRVAIPAQLRAADKLLEPKSILIQPTWVRNLRRPKVREILWNFTAGQGVSSL